MNDKNIDEKNIEEKKSKAYIVIIVLPLLMVFGFGGYIVYDKMMTKEEMIDDAEVEAKSEEQKEVVEDAITLEEAEKFLNYLVSDSFAEDLLIAETDEQVFVNAIKHLTLNKKYKKDGDQYIFNQKDIEDLAYKYYMRDNYNYISNDVNFVYNDSNQTYSSGLNFGLSSTGPSYKKTRTITDFNYADNVATLIYNVKVVYDSTELVDTENVVDIRIYKIKLIRENSNLRINEISNQ